jgi:hypothetical protein
LEALEYHTEQTRPIPYTIAAIVKIKAALEAKDEPWEKFCDSNCVWTDHHPDCKLAKDEPVQVSPLQFVEMVMEKEHLVGKPIFWAKWPNKEKNT